MEAIAWRAAAAVDLAAVWNIVPGRALSHFDAVHHRLERVATGEIQADKTIRLFDAL